MAIVNYTKGDATEPIGEGNRLIVHICNDIGSWGKGFVMAISKKWELPEKHYRQWHQSKDGFELGAVQYVEVEDQVSVANMIAQHGIRKANGVPPIRYCALESCLKKIADYGVTNNVSVHMPRIGCGLAGGDWEEVEPLVKQELLSKNIEVTVYDFE